MPKCFVIQPFDNGGKFDKRFRGVFKPAIEAAELTAYRVDQDPSVVVPIESIQEQIRDASICLAEISTDNPNVWFELGYALGVGKQVVMVCSDERQGAKFPFDIQHRSIITYQSGAPADFEELKERLTEKLKALLEKGATLQQMADADQIAPVAGLSIPELTVLSTLAGSISTPDESNAAHYVQQNAEQAGLTRLGFTLGLRRLLLKEFVETYEDSDFNGNRLSMLRVSAGGWDWIDGNEAKFSLRKSSNSRKATAHADYGETEITDDDIPF